MFVHHNNLLVVLQPGQQRFLGHENVTTITSPLLGLTGFFMHVNVGQTISSLSINTTSGCVIGMINGSYPNVANLLGVPFAAPPVADLRFAPPAPYLPKKTIDATRQGPLCPQYLQTKVNSPNVYTYDTPWLQPWGNVGEDCLTLDIRAPWTPGDYSGQALPVLMSAVSARWQDMYLAFMRDSLDGLEAVGWPRYTVEDGVGNGAVWMMGGNGTGRVEDIIPASYLEGLCVGVEETY